MVEERKKEMEEQKKKKGRPRKRHLQQQEVKEERGDHDADTSRKNTEAWLQSTPFSGFSSAEVAPACDPKYLTRNAKAYLDRYAAISSLLRTPVRNVKAQGTTTFDVTQGRSLSRNDIPESNFDPYLVHAQSFTYPPPSLIFPTPPATTPPSDATIRTYHDFSDRNKLTDDQLAQSHGPGKLCAAGASNSEVVLDSYLLVGETKMASNTTKKRATEKINQSGEHLSRSISLNLMQMDALMDDDLDSDEVGSRLNDSLVSVQGYRVKEDMVPILERIISKHGDIAKNSTFQSVTCRSYLLELACGICQKLDASSFWCITRNELNNLLEDVKDLETANIEVEWLRCRLVNILEVKQLCEGLRDEKRRNTEVIQSKKKAIEGYKKEREAIRTRILEEGEALAAAQVEAEKMKEKFIYVKPQLRTFRQSLVHNLI